MEQKNITTSIQILNELVRNDFLKIRKINLNCDFYKKIIAKKKSKNLNMLFDNINDSSQNSETETESEINDSIPVTNFTIPSSMYHNTNSN